MQKHKLRIIPLLLAAVISVSGCNGQAASKSSSTPPESQVKASSEIPSSSISSSAIEESSQESSSQVVKVSAEAPVSQPITPTIKTTGNLIVHFLDVGQADSIFIELPTENKQSMLIDAGNSENGTQITDYIKNLGYDRIDYLVATHPHADHIGGMPYVVDTVNIGSIYMPKVSHTTKTFENLLLSIKNQNLKVNTAKSGVNILSAENLAVDIISPTQDSYKDLNDWSAVIKITYKNKSVLLMGDAESHSEGLVTANISADILKVGHHGSNSSTTQSFLSKVSPSIAVISCGTDNSYGHPHQETLDTLKAANVTTYRTDKDGTIIATIDGEKVAITTKQATAPIQPNAPPSKPKSSQPTSSSSETIVAPEPIAATVYVTNTGEKYHSNGCQYLKKSKIAISLSSAKSQGYTPCSKCAPPR